MALAAARLYGRSQWDVARDAGVDPATLSRVLNRHLEPTLELASAICSVLDRQVVDLFPDLNDEDPADEPGLVTTPASAGGGDDPT